MTIMMVSISIYDEYEKDEYNKYEYNENEYDVYYNDSAC